MGWFAEQTYGHNEKAAQSALLKAVGAEATSRFTRPEPEKVLRGQGAVDGIDHFAYHVPRVWGEPSYAPYKYVISPGRELNGLMSHSGEELLYCVSGPLTYHFFWAPPGGGKPSIIDCRVQAGEMIRILPNVPHHNTAKGTGSSGWLAIRHRSGSTATIDKVYEEEEADTRSVHQGKTGTRRATRGKVKPSTDNEEPTLREGGYSRAALEDPTRSLLLLWDIPGKLRVARMRAGYSVAELAEACSIHPSYIWRLEKGDTNVSIHTLVMIAQMVRMNLSDLELPTFFNESMGATKTAVPFQRQCRAGLEPMFGSEGSIRTAPLLAYESTYDHWLHPHLIEMESGAKLSLMARDLPLTSGEALFAEQSLPTDSTEWGPDGKCTWIILSGEITFEETLNEDKIILGAGSKKPVLHMRNGARGLIEATKNNTRLLKIEYSGICSCFGSPFCRLRRDPVAKIVGT